MWYFRICAQAWKIKPDSEVVLKRCMSTTIKAATAVVKDVDTLETKEAAEASHLSPDAMATQEALLQERKSVCCVYDKYSQKLHETLKIQNSKNCGESFDLLLCNPLLNFCPQQDLEENDHGVLNTKGMEALYGLADKVLKHV